MINARLIVGCCGWSKKSCQRNCRFLRICIIATVLALAVASSNAQTPAACATNTQVQALGTWWNCFFPAFCADDYNAFPQRASQYRQPITSEKLTDQLNRMRSRQVRILTKTPAEGLRSALLDALNVRALFEGIGSRATKISVIWDQLYPYSSQSTGQYRERHLLFEDPYVGTFKGILLTPTAPPGTALQPYPAVVALHGHSETAETYRDTHFAREYPKNGLGILILTSRVMEPWLGEHDVSKNLLLNGFSLMGLHAYEALITLKYLACNKEVKPGRVGLIGHSGGSSAGNLLVRIAPKRIAAYVSDLTIDYSMLDIPEPYHCETIPKLHPYHQLVNDFATSPVRTLKVGYGYTTTLPDGSTVSAATDILRFFGELKTK